MYSQAQESELLCRVLTELERAHRLAPFAFHDGPSRKIDWLRIRGLSLERMVSTHTEFSGSECGRTRRLYPLHSCVGCFVRTSVCLCLCVCVCVCVCVCRRLRQTHAHSWSSMIN